MDNEPVFHEVFSEFLAQCELAKLASDRDYEELLRRKPALGRQSIESMAQWYRLRGYTEPWKLALRLVQEDYPNLEAGCECLACIDVRDRWP